MVRTDLSKANLEGARLDHADLTEADLSGARLRDAVLEETRLANANLEHADLTGAKCLAESQLGGCNLSHATLPEGFEIQGLGLADEAGRNLRVQLVSNLMICLYSWLTIGSTTHLDLLTNASSVSFPFIDISLPIVGLYFVAPVLVLGFFLSFYLHLAIFWDRMALLPAIFPNGDELTKKIYPSLFDSLVNRQMLWLSRRQGSSWLGRLNILMIHSGLDGLVFLTLTFYWLGYLPRHDVVGTTLHLILLFAAFFTSWAFSIVLRNKLRMKSARGELLHKSWQPALVLVLVFGLGAVSLRAFDGPRMSWGYLYADLEDDEVSVLSPEGESEDLGTVRGADLEEMNLRFANLEDAFLANASMGGSNLEGANLQHADLRNAVLRHADLTGASLHYARLQQAELRQASLAHADLRQTELSGASLSQAVLREASLAGARIDRAGFSRADLTGATLTGVGGSAADFSLARLDEVRLSLAVLPKAVFFLADLRGAHLWKARLEQASLVLADARHANFSFAGLRGADLSQGSFEDAVFIEADLSGAQLVFARLNRADFSRAELSDADLQGAELQDADLRKVRLRGATLTGAWLKRARLQGVDLSEVQGLEAKQIRQACIDAATRLPAALRTVRQDTTPCPETTKGE